MANNIIFDGIANRTGGDIYIGVVGPVRCGKSTFIAKFMRSHILPKVDNKAEQQRVLDELPQSADGSAIMTTQPKFVPAKAVSIKVAGSNTMRVRLIDCVGYLVPGATGSQTDGKIRNVKTPWSNDEMPFEKAAEIGTRKVIADHCTVAVMVTTDGTVTNIPRENYIEAEEKVLKELKKSGKPFVVVINSRTPASAECRKLAASLAEKHGIMVLPMDVESLSNDNINSIFTALLHEFGVCGFKVNMPKFLTVLDSSHALISEAVDSLKAYTKSVKRLSDNEPSKVFNNSANYQALETVNTDVATGIITYNIVPKPDLYYKVLSAECGVEIKSEQELVAYIRHVSTAKLEYDKVKDALRQASEGGYGVVQPVLPDYTLDKPQLYRNGRSWGVKLRAAAPSLHIIRVDINTEVTPTIGSQQQSEEMLKYLGTQYETDRAAIWSTNILGKNLDTLVQEGINSKLTGMNVEAQRKMKRTLTKIVNNGRGGIICILL